MKNKGITLVALIITIIILLILATVSISLVINNNVLDHAQHGVDKYSEEEELEQIKLAVASAMLKGNGFLDTDNLNSELHERIDETENAEKRGNNYYYNGFVISGDGNVEKYDKLLPKEYQQVEYIESSGTQWIDTMIKVNNNDDISISFKVKMIEDDSMLLFGARTSATQNNCTISLGNAIGLDYGTYTTNRIIIDYDKNKKNIIQIIHNNKLKVNDMELNINPVSFETDYTAYLFNGNGNQWVQNKFIGELYSCKIDSKRIFIPCYSTTSVTDVNGKQCIAGTVGLYDIEHGQFYTNQGTGTFGYGMEDGTYVAPTNN